MTVVFENHDDFVAWNDGRPGDVSIEGIVNVLTYLDSSPLTLKIISYRSKSMEEVMFKYIDADASIRLRDVTHAVNHDIKVIMDLMNDNIHCKTYLLPSNVRHRFSVEDMEALDQFRLYDLSIEAKFKLITFGNWSEPTPCSET